MTTVARSAGRTAVPRGARPPQIGLFTTVLRVLLWLVVAVTFGRPWIAAALADAAQSSASVTPAHAPVVSAPATPAVPAIPAAPVGPPLPALPALDVLTAFDGSDGALATAALHVVTASMRGTADLALRGVSAAVLLLFGIDLVVALITARRQTRRLARNERTTLLVLAPPPVVADGRGVGGATRGGPALLDDLYRALTPVLIPPARNGRGAAPWVTLHHWGAAGMPTQLGISVADRDAARRARTVGQITQTLRGLLPSVQIVPTADPLVTAAAAGGTLLWQDLRLALGDHYPLRLATDVDGSDLRGPLLASIPPLLDGVTTALDIYLRPQPASALAVGWRGRATALLLRLAAKNDYALSPDGPALEAKLDSPAFAVTIRCTAHLAPTVTLVDGRTALGTITMALGAFAARTASRRQTLVAVGGLQQARGASAGSAHAFRPRATPPAPIVAFCPLFAAPPALSGVELAGLWHLPTPSLGTLIRWLDNRVNTPPPHAFTNDHPDRIALGHGRRADGTLHPIGPTRRDLRQGLHFTAPPGVGKTRLLANICQQLAHNGYLLTDCKGDDAGNLVETMRARTPQGDEERTTVLDLLDGAWLLGLNPLADIDVTNPASLDAAMGQIESIFARLDPETWGKAPRMKQFLRKASLLVVTTVPNATLAHVKQALLDAAFRAQLLPRCTNIEIVQFWEIQFPQMGEAQRMSMDSLIARFDMLLDSPLTRYLFNAARPTLSFDAAIASRQILLLPLPHRTLGPLTGPVAMLVFQLFLRAVFRRPGSDQTRAEYGYLCDEFQVMVEKADGTDVRDALTQVRALGIIVVLANQLLAQAGELAEFLLTAISSRIVMRTQEPDASTYARHYAGSGVTAADIANQHADEHQYATFLAGRQPVPLCSMVPLPWPVEVDADAAPAVWKGDWQRAIPPDSPDPAFDSQLALLAYGPYPDGVDALATRLAAAPEPLWQRIVDRWPQLAAFHHALLLAEPGCVPDRHERQRWLSRLAAARPRVLAIAEYARIRTAIAPADASGTNPAPQTTAAPTGRGRRRDAEDDEPQARPIEERNG